MEIIKRIKRHLEADKRVRFRDRRGHYASSAVKCKRDQFREWRGEKPTDPSDALGRMKMLVGSAVENEFVKQILGDLHWYGIHLVGTQVQVGGSKPAWDGALDALVAEKKEDGSYERYVVEIKTKSGYGADMLYNTFEPSQDYMAQLGLYLRDLSRKGVTNKGCLLFFLLSDRHFGKILQLEAEYLEKTDEVLFTRGYCSDGVERDLEFRLKLSSIDSNWKALEAALAADKMPAGDYHYKYPLTAELLDAQSDAKLRKMLDGEVVLGDWQTKYSNFKTANMKADGIDFGYSQEELEIIRAEYKKRHPKSKK